MSGPPFLSLLPLFCPDTFRILDGYGGRKGPSQMQSKQRPRCSSPLLYKSEERQPYHSSYSSQQATTCATRRRPADASIGALCRYQPDTGTCVAKARRRSTCSSSIKRHERHSRRLLKWTRREDIFQGGPVSQEAQPTNPCSHRTAIIKVK